MTALYLHLTVSWRSDEYIYFIQGLHPKLLSQVQILHLHFPFRYMRHINII